MYEYEYEYEYWLFMVSVLRLLREETHTIGVWLQREVRGLKVNEAHYFVTGYVYKTLSDF